MTKDNSEFFTSLNSIMKDVMEELNPPVEEEDITIKKVIEAATAEGKEVSFQKGMRVVAALVRKGKLVFNGRRFDPSTKKQVNTYRVVIKDPGLKTK